MNWAESTPLSIANLNSLESRIAAALAEVTAGKTNLYNAIVAKGITPGSQAFADLVTAIQTTALVKTSDATAFAAQLLINATAYVNGSKIIGSMPNRAGDTACLASSISGTTLKLRASQGYRDGVDDNVTITDANWVEDNIPNNVSMFGKVGTNTNKKWQISTVTLPASNTDSDPSSYFTLLTVTGLPFTPSHVVLIPKTVPSWYVQKVGDTSIFHKLSNLIVISSKSGRHYMLDGNTGRSASSYATLSINGNSFTLSVTSTISGQTFHHSDTTEFDYYAYE